MKFSEREGFEPKRSNPLESMDEGLKKDIWTEINKIILKSMSFSVAGYNSGYSDELPKVLWTKFFNRRISDLPSVRDFIKEIAPFYEKLEWYKVYDLIEFILTNKNSEAKRIATAFNNILEMNKASYRIINSIVQPIQSKEVVKVMESAYRSVLGREVKNHLKKAQELYSSKMNPDFTNSCLESIHSVEATIRIIYKNEDALADNIKKLKNDKKYSRNIIEIITKLNAYRGSDIAHAKNANSHISKLEDAILVHTICCGFINYFSSK